MVTSLTQASLKANNSAQEAFNARELCRHNVEAINQTVGNFTNLYNETITRLIRAREMAEVQLAAAEYTLSLMNSSYMEIGEAMTTLRGTPTAPGADASPFNGTSPDG